MSDIVQFRLRRIFEKISSDSVISLKDRNKVYTCGRSKSNDIVCKDESISKRHCLFSQNENTLFVEDLGSANGVYINRILQEAWKKHPLKEGDIISLCVAEVDTQVVNTFFYRVEKEVILVSDLKNENDLETFPKLAKLTNDETISEANKRMAEEKLEVAKNMQITPSVTYEANADQPSIEMNIVFISGNKDNVPIIYLPNNPNEIKIAVGRNNENLHLIPQIKNVSLIKTKPEETLGISPAVTSSTFKLSSAGEGSFAGLNISATKKNLSENKIVIINDDVSVEETSVTATHFQNKINQNSRGSLQSKNTSFGKSEANIILDLTKNITSENSSSSIKENKSVTMKLEKPETLDTCNLGETVPIIDLCDDIRTFKKENLTKFEEQIQFVNSDSESDVEIVGIFKKINAKKSKEKKKEREKNLNRKEEKIQGEKKDEPNEVKKEVVEKKNDNKKRKVVKNIDYIEIDSSSDSTIVKNDNVKGSVSNIMAKFIDLKKELELRKISEILQLTPEQWKIIDNLASSMSDKNESINRSRDFSGNSPAPPNEIQNPREAKKYCAAGNPIDKIQFRYNIEGEKFKPVSYISMNYKLKQYQRGIPLETEFCQEVVSWNPKTFSDWFYNPCNLDESELKRNSISYKSYEDYRNVFLPLVMLDMLHAIKNAYTVVERNVSFKGQYNIVLGSIKRMFANQQFTNMLNFQITIRNSMHASKFPKFGDLLRFDIENTLSTTVIFAYIVDRPVLRKMKDSTRNEYFTEGLYTVATKELEFNLNKSTILQLRVVTNLLYFMQLAEAIDYFKDSPLMPIITKPDPINYHLVTSNHPTALVTNDRLDEKQLSAVMQITEVASRREPKVILVEGPPGTGKTQVIVNTIFQLLQNQESTKHEKPLKILVCASTEAAIDEIVLRVKSIQQTLKSKTVKMIRLGEVDQMHENTRKFSIQHMSKQYLDNSIRNFKDIEARLTQDQQKRKLAEKIEIAKKSIRETKNQGMTLSLPVLEKHLQIITSGRMIHEYTVKEYNDTLKQIQEAMLLAQNLITCSHTTIFSQRMNETFGKKSLIPLCIIDDASLMHEVDNLKLLLFGVKTLVLLGDEHKHSTKYLSSTTLEKLGMGESLFSRIKKNFTNPKDCPMITLDNQYRMNQEIAHFPNSFFYNGSLTNRKQSDQCLPIFSYRIFNLLSLIDPVESETIFAVNLILCVMKYTHFENMIKPLSIAVVVPYNSSKGIMSKAITTKLAEIPKEKRNNFLIDVNTIKGFRNQERDIVFASCIKQRGVQFLTGKQRLYSTLTIAKHCLVLYGQFETLQVENQCMWNSLIEDAKQREVFIDIDCSADFQKLKKHMIKTELKG